jgi:Phage gp6-like head-tail connector protein
MDPTLWPTLKEVRTLLRLQPEPTEDGIIQTALAAAIDYGNRRTDKRWPPTPADPSTWTEPMPDAVHEACLLHAARLYRRRDSLDGTIGWGDMGAIRVGRVDPDVEMLYASVGPVVFG